MQRARAQAHAFIQAAILGEHLKGNALFRLQADNQLVGGDAALVRIKDVVRLLTEMNDDLRQFLRHPFTGAQIERHASPAPVGHFGLHGHEGFGLALGVGALFFQVARHGLAIAGTGNVLATHHVAAQRFAGKRLQRLEHFYLLVTDGIGIQVGRRVHGNQAEQLQQVILHHIAQLARIIKVAPAAFNTHFFSDGNLDVGDMVLVPLGAEQRVGKAQGDQVLNRLFTQVVVNAVNA